MCKSLHCNKCILCLCSSLVALQFKVIQVKNVHCVNTFYFFSPKLTPLSPCYDWWKLSLWNLEQHLRCVSWNTYRHAASDCIRETKVRVKSRVSITADVVSRSKVEGMPWTVLFLKMISNQFNSVCLYSAFSNRHRQKAALQESRCGFTSPISKPEATGEERLYDYSSGH